MKTMTCIVCPLGCTLNVDVLGEKIEVTGNTCPRGAKYAISEMTNPVRTLTSVVKVENNDMLSVKTDTPIPKDLVIKAAKELSKITVKAPIHIGDVILKDIFGTGANVVATKNIETK